MAEETPDLRALARASAYEQLVVTVDRTLEGVDDPVTAMATIAALVHHGFGFLWTGFYCVANDKTLRVGPYQGTLGCLEIAVGRGVCGTATAERRTVIVPDVHAFPGHISCDARSRSEIVVPVFDRTNRLIAVFDVDADVPAAFDERDRVGLEKLLSWFTRAELGVACESHGQVQRSRQLMEEAQAIARIGSFEWDVPANVSIWSDELRRILDVGPDVVAGREAYESRIPSESLPMVANAWEALMGGTRDSIDLDHRIVLRDDTERMVHLRARCDRDPTGRPIRVVGSIQDRTEKRRVERELALDDRMLSLGRLTAGVAHEINNPLAYVLSNLELLSRSAPDTIERLQRRLPQEFVADEIARVRDVVEIIRDARSGIERVAAVVRDMKGLARVPGDSRSAFHIVRAINFAVQIASNEIKHRARLHRVDKPTPPIFANEGRIGQLVLNLLLNAIEALTEDGPRDIRIETRTDPDGRVRLEVIDSGAGIPDDIAGRIFDPFFTTRRVGQGMGLGLSICHNIVTELGGEIGFSTTAGRGTTFFVLLPPMTERDRPAPDVKPAPIATQPPSAVPTLLIVDDEVAVVRALSRLLRRDFNVTALSEGQRAIELLEGDASFDLILCDLMMPDVTGIEVYERIEAKAPRHAQRFLFVTGGAFSPRSIAFLERMRGRYIDKPFDHATLVARLGALYAELGPAKSSTDITST